MNRSRALALLAVASLTAGVLVAAPPSLASAPALPVSAAAPLPPTGTSFLGGIAFAGPGSTPFNSESGEVTHDGTYDNSLSGGSTAPPPEAGVPGSASIAVSQADTAAPRKLTSTGSTIGSASPGGSAIGRNEVRTAFTPAVSSRWKITVQAESAGPGCITGTVAFGRAGGPTVIDEEVACATQPTVDVVRFVDLLAGKRYFYEAGHPSSNALNGSFTWSITLEQKPERVKNTAKPVIKRIGRTDRLKATPGTWTGLPSKFAYQWFRNGVKILGARKQTYATTRADAGKRLSVKVTATGAGGKGTAASKPIVLPG